MKVAGTVSCQLNVQFVWCTSFSPACAVLVHVSTVFNQFCDLVEKLEKLDEDLQEVRKLAALSLPSSILPSLHPSLLLIAISLFLPFSIALLLLTYSNSLSLSALLLF